MVILFRCCHRLHALPCLALSQLAHSASGGESLSGAAHHRRHTNRWGWCGWWWRGVVTRYVNSMERGTKPIKQFRVLLWLVIIVNQNQSTNALNINRYTRACQAHTFALWLWWDEMVKSGPIEAKVLNEFPNCSGLKHLGVSCNHSAPAGAVAVTVSTLHVSGKTFPFLLKNFVFKC